MTKMLMTLAYRRKKKMLLTETIKKRQNAVKISDKYIEGGMKDGVS
jgi:hypothetical protein